MTVLYVALAILFALDAATTLYGLWRFPTKVGEANGAVVALGPTVVMTVGKVAVFAWLYFVIQPPAWALWVLIAGYVAVIANNVRVIVRAARS